MPRIMLPFNKLCRVVPLSLFFINILFQYIDITIPVYWNSCYIVTLLFFINKTLYQYTGIVAE